MKTETITKEEFLADVMHEIDMLKKHATQKEKNNLDFSEFNPMYPNSCIYGQLTGACDSKRAKSLMNKSCIRVMHLKSGVVELLGKPFSKIKHKINGKYTKQTWDPENTTWGERCYQYLSSLEGYISLSNAKNKQIIKYIKGEIDTLKL